MYTRLLIHSRFLTVTTLVGLLVAFGVSSAQQSVTTTCDQLQLRPLSLIVPDVGIEGPVTITILGAHWPLEGAVRLFERRNPLTGALVDLSDQLLFLNVGLNTATIVFRDGDGGTPMPVNDFIFPFREERGGNLEVTVNARVPIQCMGGTGLPVRTISATASSNTEVEGAISDRLRASISPREALEPTARVVSP